MSSILWIDLLLLAALALGIYRGYCTGVVRQVVGVVGIFVSFGLAVQLMSEVGSVAAASLPVAESVAPLLGFVLVFLGAQILVRALAHLAESLLDALRLSFVNRLAGSLFGAFQAALFASLLFLVMDPVGMPEPETRDASMLYDPIAAFLPATWHVAAERMPRVKAFSQEMGEQIEEELF